MELGGVQFACNTNPRFNIYKDISRRYAFYHSLFGCDKLLIGNVRDVLNEAFLIVILRLRDETFG